MIFLNNCDKYGVSIGNKNVGVVFFDDNIVLIVPSDRKMKALLHHICFLLG